MEDTVYLAPLHGFTDFLFRNVYLKHFQGIDYVVSPFISLTHGTKISVKKVKDLLPENNIGLNIIPQILGNEAELFIQLANFLEQWGYESINWNLGCPVKGIVNKKRGSGLLPYPEEIRRFLEKVIPEISQKLSVKIRLGYFSTDEIYRLIPVINDFSLDFVCIHPRIGTQMYEGNIYHDVFNSIINDFNAKLIYNGDITDIDVFNLLKTKYPSIKNWMIGRGVFYNPLLPMQIKEERNSTDNSIFEEFIFDLYNTFFDNKTEIMAVNKIKDFWLFISKRYIKQEKAFEIIAHSSSKREIFDNTRYIFNELESRY